MKRIIVFLSLFLIAGAMVVAGQRAPVADTSLASTKLPASVDNHPGRALGLTKNWKAHTPATTPAVITPTPLPSHSPRPTVWPRPKPSPTPEPAYAPPPTIKPYPSTPPCGGCGWRGLQTQQDIMCPMSVQQICE